MSLSNVDLSTLAPEELDQIISEASAAKERAKEITVEKIHELAATIGMVATLADPNEAKKEPRKLPARYVNGDKQWSGTGPTPGWLKDLEAQGHSREEFEVKS